VAAILNYLECIKSEICGEEWLRIIKKEVGIEFSEQIETCKERMKCVYKHTISWEDSHGAFNDITSCDENIDPLIYDKKKYPSPTSVEMISSTSNQEEGNHSVHPQV